MRTRLSARFASLSFAATALVATAAHAQAPGSNILPPNTISLTSFSPDSFSLNNFIFPVNLRHTVAGLTPSHYRYSHFADFRDAQWLAYQPTPQITTQRDWFTQTSGSPGYYSAPLYFQLRARNPNAGRPVSLSGGTATLQPDFVNSNTRSRTLRVTLAG